MDKIKTPVELTDGGASVEIRDADGNVIARCGGVLDGDTYYPGGLHATEIANALNNAADQSRVIEELTAELDALRREVEVGKPKWIPIPQMPSDEGLLYLLTVLESYSMKTGIAIRRLCKDDDGEAYFPFSAGKVLAWQPLPEPYTEGNNDDR